jgi:hypothetical protein
LFGLFIVHAIGQNYIPSPVINDAVYIDPYYSNHNQKTIDSCCKNKDTHAHFIERSLFSKAPYITERKFNIEPVDKSDSSLELQFNYKVVNHSHSKDSTYKFLSFSKSHEIYVPVDSKGLFHDKGEFTLNYSIRSNHNGVKGDEQKLSDIFYLSDIFKFGLGYSFFWYSTTTRTKSFYNGINGFLELNLLKGVYLKARIYDPNFIGKENWTENGSANDVFSIRPVGEITMDYHAWKHFDHLIINYGVGLGCLLNKATEKLTERSGESTSHTDFYSVGMNLDEIFILDYSGVKNFGLVLGGGYFIGVPSVCSAIYYLHVGIIAFPINFR